MQQISGTIGGRYILQQKLGEGGMGAGFQVQLVDAIFYSRSWAKGGWGLSTGLPTA
jgi:hypothetical protein